VSDAGGRTVPGGSPEQLVPALAAIVDAIRPVSTQWLGEAGARAEQLAIPAGSLGRVLDLAVRLAAIQGTLAPTFARKAVVVMAGDHGVVDQGVSAFPADVTAQMWAVSPWPGGHQRAGGRPAPAPSSTGCGGRPVAPAAAGLVVDRKVRRERPI
jgi:hypothetical protein